MERNLSIILILFSNLFIMIPLSYGQQYFLMDDQPAEDWMTEAYPIGNGRIGAMIFGGMRDEFIQFNENSLWTGDEYTTGEYQNFGALKIEFDEIEPSYASSYKRSLLLDSAIHRINFSHIGDWIERVYFASHPDDVIVLHYKSKNSSNLKAKITLEDAHESVINQSKDGLFFKGVLENGMKYEARLKVMLNGGDVFFHEDKSGNKFMEINNSSEMTVLLSASTDFANKRTSNWKSETTPEEKNILALKNASRYNFQELLERHYQDYSSLYGTLSLKIGKDLLNKETTTKELIKSYMNKPSGLVDALLYQYGRYLLISSSRKGGLPANLQGLWNDSNNPPWRSDYHSNINVQMNYWASEVANLSSTVWPFLDYINNMREVKKEHTKKEFPNVRGWTVRTENNIFGGQSFRWNTPGSAWFTQALWEHYSFGGDIEYLRSFAYPILKEVVQFWDDYLLRRDDGTVVAPNGWSPEHGPVEDAVSYDHQIIDDLFGNYISASTALSVDTNYRNYISDLRDRLVKPKIGKWGQLQEWETDRDDPNNKHRHVSHLFGLFPGKQFSVLRTPELAQAAKTSLIARGDESTGWSMVWKMAFWARLHDGNHAYKILNNFISLVNNGDIDYDEGGGVYSNLLCAHPPFQIDGNLGVVASLSEMLLQSHTGIIEVLPALPKDWDRGEIKGLRGRNEIEINTLRWQEGKVKYLEFVSNKDQKIEILLPNKTINHKEVKKIDGKYLYSFKVNKRAKVKLDF